MSWPPRWTRAPRLRSRAKGQHSPGPRLHHWRGLSELSLLLWALKGPGYKEGRSQGGSPGLETGHLDRLPFRSGQLRAWVWGQLRGDGALGHGDSEALGEQVCCVPGACCPRVSQQPAPLPHGPPRSWPEVFPRVRCGGVSADTAPCLPHLGTPGGLSHRNSQGPSGSPGGTSPA